MAVLEVLKPALLRSVQVNNDRIQAVAVPTLGFGAIRIFELAATFRTWPTVATLKVVSQEVKAAHALD